MLQHAQAQLLEVVATLRLPGRLAGGLHGGQQQGHQNTDDRNHDQKFNEREPSQRTTAHGRYFPFLGSLDSRKDDVTHIIRRASAGHNSVQAAAWSRVRFPIRRPEAWPKREPLPGAIHAAYGGTLGSLLPARSPANGSKHNQRVAIRLSRRGNPSKRHSPTSVGQVTGGHAGQIGKRRCHDEPNHHVLPVELHCQAGLDWAVLKWGASDGRMFN